MFVYIILFTVSIIASGSTSYFYKKIAQHTDSKVYSFLTGAIWMIPVSVLFLIISLLSDSFTVTSNIVLTALVAGIMLAVAAFMLIESLRKGSYTVAVIIVNMNFYIPIVLSRIFLNESATLLQLIGIFIVTIVIIMINLRSGSKDNITGIVYACIACLANGTMNFCIKLQQYNTPGEGTNSFYFFIYLFGGLICIIMALANKITIKEKLDLTKLKPVTIPALLLGICVAVCFYPQSILSGSNVINAAAQFTITITGSLILALMIGWIRYKEKFSLKSIISLILCIIAVVFQVVSY